MAVGFVLLVAAGLMVAVPLGLAVAGAGLVGVGLLADVGGDG